MSTFALKPFALAGNATFTVTSGRTGTRYTFKWRRPKEQGKRTHFVSVLTGQDNENDYSFLGSFDEKEGRYYHSAKSRIRLDAPSAVAAKWVCERILAGKELTGCEVHHEGRCGRCGRKLTVPESIESGIGPECAGRML